MTNTQRIAQLRTIVRAAAIQCRQCSGAESSYFDPQELFDDPAPWEPRAYCTKCHPSLGESIVELRKLLAIQKPRDERRYEWGRYRRDMKKMLGQIPRVYDHCHFRTYVPQNPSQALAADQLRKWAGDRDAQARFPMVVMHGPCGVGKSHLLIAAARRIAHKVSIPVLINEAKFKTQWQAAHGWVGKTPAQWIAEVRDAGMLIIDDLGKSKATEAWAAVLYEVVNHRYENRLPTVVSTNIAPADLPAYVGAATADRILDTRNHIILGVEGRSMRAAG